MKSLIAAIVVFLLPPALGYAQDWSQLKRPPEMSDSDYDAKLDEVEALLDKGRQAWEEKRIDDCIAWDGKAVAASEAWLGEGPYLILALRNLGSCQAIAGKFSEAEATYLRAKKLTELYYGTDTKELIPIEVFLGRLYNVTNRLSEAEVHFKRALDLCERLCPANSPDRADRLTDLGELYMVIGRKSEAKPLLERAAALQASPTDAP